MTKVYVTMTNKVLSGWGGAEGRIFKQVIECNDYEEAWEIIRNAREDAGVSHIHLRETKPYYSPSRYVVRIDPYKEFVVYHDDFEK